MNIHNPKTKKNHIYDLGDSLRSFIIRVTNRKFIRRSEGYVIDSTRLSIEGKLRYFDLELIE